MKRPDDLTRRQWRALALIIEGYRVQRIPSVRELGDEMQITSTNGVVDHLKALERKGYIVRRFNEARSIELTEKTLLLAGLSGVTVPARLWQDLVMFVAFPDACSWDRIAAEVERLSGLSTGPQPAPTPRACEVTS